MVERFFLYSKEVTKNSYVTSLKLKLSYCQKCETESMRLRAVEVANALREVGVDSKDKHIYSDSIQYCYPSEKI